jgi:hypothetical protein
MAPPMPGVAEDQDAAGPKLVPIPSAHFIGRYMNRLEERQKAAPKEQIAAPVEEEGDDVEKGKDSRAYALRQKLDFTQWGNFAQFWGMTTKHHKALKWWGADTQNRRLVRCMTFWLYCFTHMYFVSVYSRDSEAACVEPPGYPDPIQIDCNLIEGETDSRRLTSFLVDTLDHPSVPARFRHRFNNWGTELLLQGEKLAVFEERRLLEDRSLQTTETTAAPTDAEFEAAARQAQCDAAKELAQAAYTYYEECAKNTYLFNMGPFKMTFRAFVIVFFMSVATALVVALFNFSFVRNKIRTKKSLAEKLRIVQFWKLKELFALVFCVCWIIGCVWYLFFYSLSKHGEREYASTMLMSTIMQWVKPFGMVFLVFLFVKYARKPIPRFFLTLMPAMIDLKNTAYEKPEDVVAGRRERQKRKDLLRKEVNRLRKSTDQSRATSRANSRAPSEAGKE